eukprot:748122-Hanusia_phi.AAC.2
MIAEAENALLEHREAQRSRVESLSQATNTSQLANYQRLAKLEYSSFLEAAGERLETLRAFAGEALQGLKRMNKQFLDSCLVFEELGGPAGKGGLYNSEEVSAYRQYLDELDADAAERQLEWIKYGEELLEGHKKAAGEELEKFQSSIAHVETDIKLLESVDKEIRSCSLMQQQEIQMCEARMEAVEGKLVELEGLCAGVPMSFTESYKSIQLEEEEEEEKYQSRPLSLCLLICLESIRWRILQMVKYTECLQSDIQLAEIELVPPQLLPQPDVPEELEQLMEESEYLSKLKPFLWPKKEQEGGEGEEAEAAPAEAESEAHEAPRYAELLSSREMAEELEGTFKEAIDKIQEKQRDLLLQLVSSYFDNLGEREITRKAGAPATTSDRFIPEKLEDFTAKNEARLTELRESAMLNMQKKVQKEDESWRDGLRCGGQGREKSARRIGRGELRLLAGAELALDCGEDLDGDGEGAECFLPEHRGTREEEVQAAAEVGGGEICRGEGEVDGAEGGE